MNNKKVGILGSGQVAKTLGEGFINLGYQVMLGTSTISKLDAWKAKHTDALVGSFQEAADFGEMLVLAVKGSAAEAVLQDIAPSSLNGKTIIDTTNPIADVPPVNGVLKYFTTLEDSLMERLQQAFPFAHFVKAFNIVGNQFMVNPNFKEGKPTMFICGNNLEAKSEVNLILDSFGWEVEDLGKVEAARAIEPLCILWCIPGFLTGRWNHVFKLLKS